MRLYAPADEGILLETNLSVWTAPAVCAQGKHLKSAVRRRGAFIRTLPDPMRKVSELFVFAAPHMFAAKQGECLV